MLDWALDCASIAALACEKTGEKSGTGDVQATGDLTGSVVAHWTSLGAHEALRNTDEFHCLRLF
jgi:hypothetical protein